MTGPTLMDRLPVPRRQVFEPVDFVVGQPVQEIGDIGLRIEVTELGCLDDGHDGGGIFTDYVVSTAVREVWYFVTNETVRRAIERATKNYDDFRLFAFQLRDGSMS